MGSHRVGHDWSNLAAVLCNRTLLFIHAVCNSLHLLIPNFQSFPPLPHFPLAITNWSRKWQHILIFLPGKSHGQRSLVGYSPWGCKGSDMTEHVCTHTHTHAHTHTYVTVCICYSQTPSPSLPYPTPSWQSQICALYLRSTYIVWFGSHINPMMQEWWVLFIFIL